MFFFFLMIRRPPRSTLSSSSAASDVYKRQYQRRVRGLRPSLGMGEVSAGAAIQILGNLTTTLQSPAVALKLAKNPELAAEMVRNLLAVKATEWEIPPVRLAAELDRHATRDPCIRRLAEELERAMVPPHVPPDSLHECAYQLEPLEGSGATVTGIDLRRRPSDRVIAELETEMAGRGFLVFKNQRLDGEQHVAACELFGGRRVHSEHGVHPEAPNRHVLRVSNDEQHGVLGVGPQVFV
eukprot:TRINITY_DN16256_c0_g1_i2.p1 TRINITY_DN16256_c0_g1~~TRINITY_DN16256_c0_g1_i2.p1  ORF type:complete len:239 (-),score=68.51 TRINITY_DN16256_c0_g1_i2:1119-1835(-)